MSVIHFKKEDFKEENGAFQLIVAHETSINNTINVQMLYPNGVYKPVIVDVSSTDTEIKVGVGREELIFDGKILIS